MEILTKDMTHTISQLQTGCKLLNGPFTSVLCTAQNHLSDCVKARV